MLRSAERSEGNALASTTHFVSELPAPWDGPRHTLHPVRPANRLPGPPSIFALGYHQCCQNYHSEKDICTVHSQFEALDYPCNVLCLDI
jgi:hypothetical protein